MTKKCIKCGNILDIEMFYKHKKMADGHLNMCKECSKKATKRYASENKEYVMEYDRNRKNAKQRTEQTRKRMQLLKETDPEKYKRQVTDSKKNYRKRNKEKWHAHEKLLYAVCAGKIKNPNICERCKKECDTEAHHYDYSKPLDVIWLCDYCHKEVHKEMRRERRNCSK